MRSNLDFSKLEELYTKASKAQVSASLHFLAGCESFDVTITSSAVSENFSTKDYSQPAWVIESAIEHLDKLLSQQPAEQDAAQQQTTNQ